MKIRKLLFTLAVLATQFGCLAQTEIDGLNYTLNSDGTATVEQGSPEPIGDLIIPTSISYDGKSYSVTSIGQQAFYNCRDLTSVTIPNSVTSIQELAFSGCSALTKIEIGKSVTSIGISAFQDCTALPSINISDSVSEIGKLAFKGCTSLTSLVIPNSVTLIGLDAFLDCPLEYLDINSPSIRINLFYNYTTLKNVNIGNSVKTIADNAFKGCTGLTTINIPNSVTSIGSCAFDGCTGIAAIKLPDSVISLGTYAFRNCMGLISLEIPNSVTRIGVGCFMNTPIQELHIDIPVIKNWFMGLTSLKSINFGHSVTNIEDSAFKDCTGVSSINFSNSISSIGSSAFEGCTALKKVELSQAVSIIEAFTFKGCSELTDVSFPSSTTVIGNSAFEGCTSLTALNIPNSVETIGESAFSDCTALKKVEISQAISIIEAFTFKGCSELTDVSFPSSITVIGNSAFEGCSSLTSVKLPLALTTINSNAFLGCVGLRGIVLPYNVTNVDGSAFTDCKNLVKSAYPNTISNPFKYGLGVAYRVDENIYENDIIYGKQYGSIEFVPFYIEGSFKIPETVVRIGSNAFALCDKLNEVIIPESIATIETKAFDRCSALDKVSINDLASWCSIDFAESSSLYENYMDAINGAESDDSVITIILEANPLSYANHLLLNGEEVEELNMPADATHISDFAFANCRSIKKISIQNPLTTIGKMSFFACPNLTEIKISETIDSIDSRAFLGSKAIENLQLENPVPPAFFNAFKPYVDVAMLTVPNESYIDYLFSEWKAFLKMQQEDGNIIFEGSDDVFKYKFIEGNKEAVLINDVSYSNLKSASIPERTVGVFNNNEQFYPVIGIADGSFENCNNLTKIDLPSRCKYIGKNAFANCSELTAVSLPNTLLSIGDKAFAKCSKLTVVEIPNSVISLGDYVFSNCSALTNASIGNSVTSLNNGVFFNCTALSNVSLPNSVTTIGESSFQGCSNLVNIKLPELVTLIGNSAFKDCRGLSDIIIPNETSIIGNQAFADCSNITSLELGLSLQSIEEGAFYNCKIADLTLPSTLTYVGKDAFYSNSFNSLNFMDGMEELYIEGNKFNVKDLYLGRNLSGSVSFSNINMLEIGGFVNNIHQDLFEATFLTNLVINPGSGITIGDNTFKDSHNLISLTLPADVTEIGENAFSSTGLKDITIPGGIIGDNAFSNCNLENVIIGANVRSIGEKTFDGCNDILNVYATPTTPPSAQNNTFSYYGSQLWVPEESIDTYYNNMRCWYRFNGKPLVCPDGINIDNLPGALTDIPGKQFKLSAVISPDNVTLNRILWTSTNPNVATVDNDGVVTIHNFQPATTDAYERGLDYGTCQIIASTLYEDGPKAVVNIEGIAVSVEYVESDYRYTNWGAGNFSNDIITIDGIHIKRDFTQEDIDALTPGIYIIGGKKVVVK